MSHIPTEVLYNILCRLPVKSLLRLRCVSKSWHTLIDDRGFTKSHLSHSLDLKTSSVDAELILFGDSSFCSVPFDSIDGHITDFTIVAQPSKLTCPLRPNDNKVLVMGYCDGMFLLSVGLDGTLWNPSTRKYRTLPHFEFKKLPKGKRFLHYHGGFGYDHKTDDYKVVTIMQATGSPSDPCFETAIYSLKSNSWKRAKEFPRWIHSDKGGVLALGALHWLAYVPTEVDDEFMIVALDLATEDYEPVPLPEGMDAPYRVDLGALGGCLSMSSYYRFDRVDIWLMKERQNLESWVKLLSVPLVDVNCALKNVMPITYSRSGGHVLLEKDSEQLVWYDLKTKTVKKVWTVSGPDTFNTVLHVGSLVKLGGDGGDVGKKIGRAEMKEIKIKKRDDFLSKGFKLKL